MPRFRPGGTRSPPPSLRSTSSASRPVSTQRSWRKTDTAAIRITPGQNGWRTSSILFWPPFSEGLGGAGGIGSSRPRGRSSPPERNPFSGRPRAHFGDRLVSAETVGRREAWCVEDDPERRLRLAICVRHRGYSLHSCGKLPIPKKKQPVCRGRRCVAMRRKGSTPPWALSACRSVSKPDGTPEGAGHDCRARFKRRQ